MINVDARILTEDIAIAIEAGEDFLPGKVSGPDVVKRDLEAAVMEVEDEATVVIVGE